MCGLEDWLDCDDDDDASGSDWYGLGWILQRVTVWVEYSTWWMAFEFPRTVCPTAPPALRPYWPALIHVH